MTYFYSPGSISPFLLVNRLSNINKLAFFSAIGCVLNHSNVLGATMFRMLCKDGSSIDALFKNGRWPKDYTLEKLISEAFSLDVQVVSDFLRKKKEGEETYYVDICSVEGYDEAIIFGEVKDEMIVDIAKLRKDISVL